MWKSYVNGNESASKMMRPIVRDSWKRCRQSGVDPYQKSISTILNAEELERLKEINQHWLKMARPIVQTLHRFVAGSGFVVTVADKDGYLLEVIGDQDIQEAIRRGGFLPGALWNETSAGTNAIGTTLILDQPVQIFSYEHFCICSHHWTCSAAPIRDCDQTIIGILDLTGPFEKVNPHTLGMVVAGADAVETQLAMEKAWHERDVANRSRQAIMESIREGVLAVDLRQRIIHFNREATRILKTAPEEVEGKALFDVLWSQNKDLFAIAAGKKYVTDQEMDVATPKGAIRLTLSSHPIHGEEGGNEGVVIVFNEIARAKRLVQKMSGAIARFTFDDIIGREESLKKSVQLARSAATSDSTILLLGESGTGKDIFAQAIHNASDRCRGPFVAINCGGIPRDLIESELFGYAEGAFSGARKGGNPGKFELADGGTIFLDEIGDMPMDLQRVFLRVLEQKTITRIGGSSMLPVDVRVIAATNRDLTEAIRRGSFRQDLYFRLNVLRINIPPLRERRDDIEILTYRFLRRMKDGSLKSILSIDNEALRHLRNYSWPGNVRELQNVLERALHMVDGDILELDHLPEEIQTMRHVYNVPADLSQMSTYEKEVIVKLLDKYEWNISLVSKHLRIARTTLYRKIKKYGLR